MTAADLDTILGTLYTEYAARAGRAMPLPRLLGYPAHVKRQLVDQLLCVRDPDALGPLPENVVQDMEALLQREAAGRAHEIVRLEDIPAYPLPTSSSSSGGSPPSQLSFLRGDLTRLDGPLVLVNPANTRMLGCFRPPHKCLDNVLHAAAGPRLRNACYAEMQRLGREELDTSEPMFTPPGVLPVSGIVHVAGPALAPRAQPTESEKDELARAYTATLDMVAAEGRRAVAFPCISTGVFAFPSALAARIALSAVTEWLGAYPGPMHVLFVLWTPGDEADYAAAAAEITPDLPFSVYHPPLRSPDTVREWVREADHIIIHAGAGLSADAVRPDLGLGLDYTSTELFARLYPGLVRRTPVRRLYDTIGYEWDDRLTQWGFIFAHAHTIFNWGPTAVYADLLALAESKRSYAVLTSNADGLFVQSGFDTARVHTPQGSYARFQCLKPCTPESYFDSAPWVAAAVPHLDLRDPRIPEGREDLIPKCERCGGEVFLNVRGGDWFLETPHEAGRRRYEAALEAMMDSADGGASSSSWAPGSTPPAWYVTRPRSSQSCRVCGSCASTPRTPTFPGRGWACALARPRSCERWRMRATCSIVYAVV
jgi:O-acetyl-ADP-ribose deacetylase (regulator of RNase III)/NAD-dependent SIR2 family protein deacetylase